MESLEDFYQELLIKKKKFNLSVFKFGGSALLGLGCVVNPFLNLMIFPTLGYGICVIYNGNHFCSTKDKFFDFDIQSYEEFVSLNSNYKYLLSEIKTKILDKMNIIEPMEIFAVSYYMIRNGFLSIDHEFYDEESIDYCPFSFGTSIVSGSGVCRNLAPFLTDLLKESNYESYNIEMGLHNQQIYSLLDEDYHCRIVESEDINQKEIKKNFLEKFIRRKISKEFNHVGTLLANNDKSYIMDLMNNTFYCIHGNFVYPYYSNESVQAKLDCDYIYEQIKIPSVSSAQLDKEKLVEIYANARLQCDDYFYTFQKFYLEHRELYEEMDFQRKDFIQKQLKIKSL